MQVDHHKDVRLIYGALSEEEIGQDCPMELVYTDADGERKEVLLFHRYPRDVFDHYYEISYRLPADLKEITEMKLYLVDQGGYSELKSLELYQDEVQTVKLSPETLRGHFETNAAAALQTQYIRYEADGERVWIAADEEMLARLNRSCQSSVRAYGNILFFFAAASVCLLICRKRLTRAANGYPAGSIRQYTFRDWTMLALLILIFAGACVMAFGSDYCAHPDENVTRMAIDYYKGGWLPPRMNSEWAAGTFSSYGISRLEEASWYYFFAGKTGWLFQTVFGIRRYYRMLGLVMLGILLSVCWKKRNAGWWSYIAVCTTPQLWYLFSYATSDAWDYFWSFWVIYELAEEKSAYRRLMIGRFSDAGTCMRILCCSVIFSMLLLGKGNYYLVLLLAFVVLVYRWFRCEKKHKLRVLTYDLVILFLSLGMAWGKAHVTELYHNYEVISSSNSAILTAEEMLSVRARGISLPEMIFGYGNIPFWRILFSSMVGVYAWMSIYSEGIYIVLLYLAYLGVFLSAVAVCRADRQGRMRLALLPLFAVLMTGVVIFYCYNVTYQPQGRYLLPLFLVAGYAAGSKSIQRGGRGTEELLFLCTLLSLFSFYYTGIGSLVLSG